MIRRCNTFSNKSKSWSSFLNFCWVGSESWCWSSWVNERAWSSGWCSENISSKLRRT